MTDLAVAILGSGDTTYANAAALIEDHLPDDHMVLIPYINSTAGMKTVIQYLEKNKVDFKRVRKSQLLGALGKEEAKAYQVWVLGIEGLEAELKFCLSAGIPLMDITRGMYQPRLPLELPLDGAVSHAETVSGDSGIPARAEPSQDLTAALERIAELEEEVKRLTSMTTETNWEPSLEPVENPKTGIDAIKEDPGLSEAAGLTPYWKSKRGKLRKAGKSKPRPGEVKVYLTEEEIDALDS